MASGTPVFCTGQGGAGEYMSPGVNSILLRPGDPSDLAAAVQQLAGSPSTVRDIRAEGLKTAQKFSSDDWSRRIEAALWSATSGRLRHALE